ncbi:MAG: F0F1 ATP synthase subunit epsilon [Myxococcaceae bacterium]
MATRLKLDVVTPERRVLAADADEVIAPGADGLFGVRPGHTPYLAVMQPGPLTVREGTAMKKFFVSGGFVEVADDNVRVLADTAEALEGIDLEGARKRIADAESKLAALSPSVPAYAAQQLTVRKEKARLDAAQKR